MTELVRDSDVAAGPVAARVKRKVYLNVILPLFLASVIAYIDRINIGYAALTMNADLGFNPEVFGRGAGIFFAGYVLFEIPGALIAERYSRRLWLARIMVSWGIVSVLMAFMRTELHFLVLRFLLGAAEASLYPVIYASFIPRWFARADRARAIALLLTSLQISSIVGAPLAGWLLGVTFLGLKGWMCLFILEGIPAIVFGVVLSQWLADDPETARWLTPEEKAYLVDQYVRERDAAMAERRYTVLQALSDPNVLKLSLIYFLWITGFWGFNYWMPQVLKGLSGWSPLAIGLITLVPMGASLAFMLFIGHSSSKTGEKRWHGAICMFLAAFGLGAGAFVHDFGVSFVFLVVTALGVYGAFGVWWSFPTTFLSGAAAAGAVGLINSAGNVGGFVGPYVTGWIKNRTGAFTQAWAYLAGSLFLAGVLILTFSKLRDAPPSSVARPGADPPPS